MNPSVILLLFPYHNQIDAINRAMETMVLSDISRCVCFVAIVKIAQTCYNRLCVCVLSLQFTTKRINKQMEWNTAESVEFIITNRGNTECSVHHSSSSSSWAAQSQMYLNSSDTVPVGTLTQARLSQFLHNKALHTNMACNMTNVTVWYHHGEQLSVSYKNNVIIYVMDFLAIYILHNIIGVIH